jgi:hypothetical protein
MAAPRRRTFSDSSPDKLSPRSRSAISLSLSQEHSKGDNHVLITETHATEQTLPTQEQNALTENLKRSASLKSLENGDEEFKDAIDERIPNFFSTMESR